MHSPPISNRGLSKRERFIGWTAASTVAVGVMVFVGWAADVGLLRSVLPGQIGLKANGAVAFVMAGIALWLLRRERPSRGAVVAARFAALAAATIGGVTMFEWIAAVDLRIDQLFFIDQTAEAFALPPGRMSPSLAICFFLLGTSLFLAATFADDRYSPWFSIITLFFFVSALAGFALDSPGILPFLPFLSTAFPASIAGVLLSCGVAALVAERGPLRAFLGDDVAGLLGRRWLPVACLTPPIVGWIVLQGVNAGLYHARYAYALFGVSTICVLSVGVVLVARQVQRLDQIRRTAEAALRASEARFRQLADSMPQIVWTARPDGKADYINRRWMEYAGIPLTHEDDSWRRGVHPDDLPKIDAAWDDALRTGEFHQVEYRLKDVRFGGYRRHLKQAVADRDEGGKIVRWFGTSTDIEELKRADEALMASERRFQLLLEGVPQMVWTSRSDGWCDYLSPQWSEYSGIPAASLLGYGWSEAVHADDREAVLARWREVVASGEPFDVEYRIRSAAGEYRWFKTRAVRFLQEDGTEKWFGTNTDISRLKDVENELREFNATLERRVAERTEKLRESEERLRLMIEGVKDHAIFMLDAAGFVVGWNPGAERLKGYRADEILGRHFSCFFLPDDLAAGRPAQILKTALEQGQYEEEGRRIRQDGTIFHAAVHLTPLFTPEQRHIGFVEVTRDVTARIQAEEERRQALFRTRFVEQTIAAREDEQRRLARELHDGIGQSLTSLRMALRVVEQADDVSTAQAAAHELRSMVVRTEDEVRRLTRNLRPAVLDDLGLVPALSRLADEVRRSQKVQIRLDAANAATVRLPDVVETALYRIAQEALTNVVKHAGAETIDLRLDCAPTGVQLTVADDGVGYDATAPSLNDGGRFGIVGMRERVALLNGAFEIEGRPDGGTTILVTIPFPEDVRP